MSTEQIPDWAGRAQAVLDRAGYRRGTARTAIIDALSQKRCAVTAQELEDELRARHRSVGRASIYRVLEMLCNHGIVQRLEVGEGVTRYEPVDFGGEHHHHLVCRHCGRLVPFADQDLEHSIDSLTRRLSFAVEDHEVVLHGSCERCNPA